MTILGFEQGKRTIMITRSPQNNGTGKRVHGVKYQKHGSVGALWVLWAVGVAVL